MKIGMILMSTIGGSSGVLYGSAYMSASKAIGEREVLDKQALSDMLNAMLEGICHRGNSQPGMKTMIDPLYLAANAYKSALERDSEVVSALRAMKAAAQEGMEKTKDMEAVRGRAYYQADKGRGHLDPGAVTMFYQLAILVDCILEKLSTAN